MNSYQLFRRSRIRLALSYALVMGVILSLSGFGMYRSLVQSNWAAMEREMESIAGTLHDSLEPMLPASGDPITVLRQILPELCSMDRPCNTNPTLIQRHTIGISDRSTYYLRLFDRRGELLAFSPNQPAQIPQTLHSTPWQTLRSTDGIRYHQFIIILHGGGTHHGLQHSHPHSSWGYLQIGRTLESFDAEVNRMQWILSSCLNDLVSDSIEEFLELADAANISLIGQIPNAEIYVLGYESQLYRLVANLIANAIQYTPAGGSVIMSLASDDRTAFIIVKDTGIGIAPSEQNRIFDRFYRVDSDRSRKTGGTGLGLAIVRAIAQVHHGSIQVQSELDRGSKLTLRLPLTTVSVQS